MQNARVEGTRIGLLLDFDQGSMTVWRDDELLGVMVSEGLSGEFSWAMTLPASTPLASGRIEARPTPASLTSDELAAARAWDRRERLHLSEDASDAECDAEEEARAEAAAEAAETQRIRIAQGFDSADWA